MSHPPEIHVCTIGFTRKSAQRFFGLLKESGAKRIVDVRLNNRSQLAGFAKQEDLKFFAQEICGMDYVHLPELAPTQHMLDAYKKHRGGWPAFERAFLALMQEREIEKSTDPKIIHGGCLLCSEDRPHHCHRRLVASYLKEKWDFPVAVTHLT